MLLWVHVSSVKNLINSIQVVYGNILDFLCINHVSMKTFYIDYLILVSYCTCSKTLLYNNVDSYHYKLPDFNGNDFKVLLFIVISFNYGKQFFIIFVIFAYFYFYKVNMKTASS